MPCEDCLNRRDFLAKSALAAAALVAAEGCGDGQIGPVIPNRTGGGDPFVPIGGPFTVKVSDLPGLATVGKIVIDDTKLPERALVRLDATSFQGLSRICTHRGCDVDVDAAANIFQCPCHLSRFSANGGVLNGPNQDVTGPITPLRTLATSFDATANTVTIA